MNFRLVGRWRIIALFFVLFSSTVFLSFDEDDFELAKNLDIYYTMFRELNMYYVDKTNSEELVKTSIDKMLKTLDPYTVYYPESQMEDYRFMTTGEYGGIGALIHSYNNQIVISEPYEGYPAHKEGLRAGDIILKIKGKDVTGLKVNEISKFLKGQPKTPVRLLIERPGIENPFEKQIHRERITVDNVPYYGMLNDKIGYIKLTGFTDKAGSEVEKALKDLKKNHNMQALVFDLRGNPGGLLYEAVKIVNFFVKKGENIVSTLGKVKQWNRTLKATKKAFDKKMPVVVLVSSMSASASEIVSGALQDLDRAVIVGQRSFGKGLVQTTRNLSYNSKLKLTTAKYYIPSGRCIQALDYSHRRADGSVGTVPDSLISEFKTKNGRTVYDGGGITPDFLVTKETNSPVIMALGRQNIIFDFATYYAAKYDSIAPADKFKLSDNEYVEFIEYTKKRDFIYTSQSEESLQKLIEFSKKEKNYQMASSELEKLKNKFKTNVHSDLMKNKKEISILLGQEIVSRYYFQKGRIQQEIQNSKEVKKAISILNNPDEYKAILSN